MTHGAYHIISESTEDCFDEVGSLDEALRIARALVKEGQAGDPISIEHNGRVIRQVVLTREGAVAKVPIH